MACGARRTYGGTGGRGSKHAAGKPWRRRCATTTRRRTRRLARSASPACSITWPISKRELRALPEKPVVIGHSMGGLIALLLCARGLAPRRRAAHAGARRPACSRSGPRTSLAFARIQMKLGLVAQAAPRDPRPRRCRTPSTPPIHGEGSRTAFCLRARFGPGPVRDGAALARWQQGDDVDPRLRRPCRCCSLPPRRIGSRRRTSCAARPRASAHVSDYVEYPGQGHWVLGQPGWERVADDTAVWLDGKTA